MRQYKTKQFTVTVEPSEHVENLKCVRVFANCGNVAFMYNSTLLLGAESGREPASKLLKVARVEASEQLEQYKKRAQAILEVTMERRTEQRMERMRY